MEYFWGLGGKVSMQPAIRIQKTSYLTVPRISAQRNILCHGLASSASAKVTTSHIIYGY